MSSALTPRRTGTINGQPRARSGGRANVGVDVQYFIDHVLDTKLTIPARVAQALDYGAKTAPGAIIAYNVLLQMVMGFAKQPRLGTEEVLRLRSKMTAATKILNEKYGRGKHAIPGVGVRATFSADDRSQTSFVKKKSLANSAMRAFVKETEAIDVKELSKGETRDWFINNQKNLLDKSNDLIKRLLPPKT